MTYVPAVLSELVDALTNARLRFASERELGDGVARLLEGRAIHYLREFKLGRVYGRSDGRIDFAVPTSAGSDPKHIGLELKTQGTLLELTRQVHGYAQSPLISALIVVTTRAGHRALPPEFNGKPVRVAHLVGSAL